MLPAHYPRGQNMMSNSGQSVMLVGKSSQDYLDHLSTEETWRYEENFWVLWFIFWQLYLNPWKCLSLCQRIVFILAIYRFQENLFLLLSVYFFINTPLSPSVNTTKVHCDSLYPNTLNRWGNISVLVLRWVVLVYQFSL